MNTLKKLLVVDDDPAYRDVLAQALGGGFEVRTASDGEEALGECRSARPDVIVLDLFMPRASGFDVLRELGLDAGTAGIPVVVLSAALLDAGARSALAARANVRAVLDKLITLGQLREAVAAIC